LAFSLDIPSRLLWQGPRSSSPIVAIGPISYGDPENWPTPNPAVHQFYIENLTTFAHWLIGRGYRILLFVSSGADRAAAGTLRERLQERYGPDVLRRVLEPPVTRVHEMLEEISKADLVVASRLHGVLLSHLLRKPVLAISWDRKVGAHMDDLGQAPYCVNIAQADFQLLCDTFAVLERNALQVREHIDAYIHSIRPLIDAQYDRLLQLCENHSPEPKGSSPCHSSRSHSLA